MLNEKLLEEATRLSAQRTFSRTVDLALAEFVRRARAGQILGLAGSGLWEGDLAEMRRDAPPRRRNHVPDCLIAACAIQNGVTVLHKDRDYSGLALASPLMERVIVDPVRRR